MMRARAALLRHVQVLFETELAGSRYSLASMEIMPEEERERAPGQRRESKYKESVEVRFGDFNMTLESPEEAPPFGRARLDWPGGELEGRIDGSAWAAFGNAIRQYRQPHEETDHVTG